MNTGAISGPLLTKWYQGLNRLKFTSETKAVVYRVRLRLLSKICFSNDTRFGWIKQFWRQVRYCSIIAAGSHLRLGAVALFFTSMAFLEGGGITEASRRLQDAYVPTLIRNWWDIHLGDTSYSFVLTGRHVVGAFLFQRRSLTLR